MQGVLESAAAVAAAAAPAGGAANALQQFLQTHLAMQQQHNESMLKAQLAAQETMRQVMVSPLTR